MRFRRFIILLLFLSISSLQAQDKDITQIIDELTLQWDETADKMRTYQGMKDYCHNSNYRYVTIALLKDIHHQDSILYNIVSTKFDKNGDKEAKATLDDIVLLEKNYTTKSFLKFLHKDCGRVNEIENNFARKGGSKYEKEQKILESELENYIRAITQQIDIVDKHIHHLEGL